MSQLSSSLKICEELSVEYSTMYSMLEDYILKSLCHEDIDIITKLNNKYSVWKKKLKPITELVESYYENDGEKLKAVDVITGIPRFGPNTLQKIEKLHANEESLRLGSSLIESKLVLLLSNVEKLQQERDLALQLEIELAEQARRNEELLRKERAIEELKEAQRKEEEEHRRSLQLRSKADIIRLEQHARREALCELIREVWCVVCELCNLIRL
jgi:hypothetical protein